jgi:hypothetical protein
MKILFNNTIAELQLVKDMDIADYEFHHKIYELKRAKFFTPLTQLSLFNEDISNEFFSETLAVILANVNRSYDYN